MKRKYIIGLAMAIMAAGAADATVYLLKDGNVVASYSDDEVDSITFEDPTQYDVVTENVLMHTSYYSDAMADYGYNYYIYLSDKPFSDKGILPLDAYKFTLRLQAPEPAVGQPMLAPAGTYRLGTGTVEDWTINPEISYVTVWGFENKYSDAVFELSYDANYNVTATLKATDVNGVTYCTTYQGETTFEDQSVNWLREDVNIQGGTLIATYLEPDRVFDMNCNMNIMIADKGYDENGWMVTPGNLLTFVGNVKLTSDGHFVPATWTIKEGDVAEENTFLAGKILNFLGGSFPANTTLKYYKDASDIEVGLVKSGSVTIDEVDSGMYRMTYDLTTSTGNKVTGTYFGRIEVRNFTHQETWHLDGDYEMNLDGAVADCMDFTSEIKLEVVRYNENIQWVGDRIDLRIIAKSEFGPGVYKVEDDGNCDGTILTGIFGGTWASGSSFYKYSDDGSAEILKGSGITGGQITITDNSDGTWTIVYDLVDDQPDAHKITGSWTGPVIMK